MRRWNFAIVASAGLVLLAGRPAHAADPRAKIEGEVSGDLRDAIVSAIGDTDRPIRNRFEARRRARAAAEDAVTVLRSEGYYAYEVDPDVEGEAPPVPVVQISPGPLFTIADPTVDWVGQPPAEPVQNAARDAMDLQPGSPGRAAAVLAAEGRIVSAVQKRGYADAEAAPRQVIVDHADESVRPTFRIAAGDLVRLDGIELGNETRTSRRWLQRLTPWSSGDVYDPESVAELERRLLDTGVYDTVTVALAAKEKTTPKGLRPVVVSLSDRKPRTLELGASYSTSEGAGLDARWTRYNILGRADTLQLIARLSDVDSRLGADLSLPHWRRPQRTLHLGTAAYRTRTDAYDESGIGAQADLTRRFGKASYFSWGGSIDYSHVDEVYEGDLSPLGRDLLTLAATTSISLDRADNPLDPTHGWRVKGQVQPTYIGGSQSLAYLKLDVQGSAYLPLGEAARTVLAARVRVGSIVNGSIPELPASRRFYAGGGGSVRGYPYQGVGPRLANNTPQGGLSLLETSFEVRQKLTDRWGVVAFVDAGAVTNESYPTGDNLSVGAGLGVRYDLGFGPIRADVAVPLNKRSGDPAFQVYLSIGQSF